MRGDAGGESVPAEIFCLGSWEPTRAGRPGAADAMRFGRGGRMPPRRHAKEGGARHRLRGSCKYFEKEGLLNKIPRPGHPLAAGPEERITARERRSGSGGGGKDGSRPHSRTRVTRGRPKTGMQRRRSGAPGRPAGQARGAPAPPISSRRRRLSVIRGVASSTRSTASRPGGGRAGCPAGPHDLRRGGGGGPPRAEQDQGNAG